MGVSQESALTLVCAAPAYPFLSDYKRVWQMDLTTVPNAELKDYFRWHDPRHETEDRVFEMLGYIDIQNLANRVRAEVLWSIGLMDCVPAIDTVRHLQQDHRTKVDAHVSRLCARNYAESA